MTVDFTKLPFLIVEDPHAATLTEAIAAEPVSSGFVIVAFKVEEDEGDFIGKEKFMSLYQIGIPDETTDDRSGLVPSESATWSQRIRSA